MRSKSILVTGPAMNNEQKSHMLVDADFAFEVDVAGSVYLAKSRGLAYQEMPEVCDWLRGLLRKLEQRLTDNSQTVLDLVQNSNLVPLPENRRGFLLCNHPWPHSKTHTTSSPDSSRQDSEAIIQPQQWNTGEPPKDGRLIVAIGRLIYTEDACTTVQPIPPSLVRWTEKPGESKGWHYRSGMSVAMQLDDEVMIDGWMEVAA